MTPWCLSRGTYPSSLCHWPNADYEIFLVALVATSAQSSLSSATSSTLSTAATSPTAACNTAGPVIQNGGFESGSLSPWITQATVGQSTNSIVSPGSTNPGGGTYAFSANLQLPNSPYGNGAVSQTLKQTLNTCAGANYSISADYDFASVGTGNVCSFTMQYPQGSVAVDTRSSATGVWRTAAAKFQAVSDADVVGFMLTCSAPGTIEVDSVNVARF